MHLLTDLRDDPRAAGHPYHDEQQVTDPALEPQTRWSVQRLIDLLEGNVAFLPADQQTAAPDRLAARSGPSVSEILRKVMSWH
jgi:hypothetical protein